MIASLAKGVAPARALKKWVLKVLGESREFA
jgi:hypothetical protein